MKSVPRRGSVWLAVLSSSTMKPHATASWYWLHRHLGTISVCRRSYWRV